MSYKKFEEECYSCFNKKNECECEKCHICNKEDYFELTGCQSCRENVCEKDSIVLHNILRFENDTYCKHCIRKYFKKEDDGVLYKKGNEKIWYKI